MELILAFSEEEDIFGTLADHLVFAELQAWEEREMRAESAVNMRQATLRNDIAGNLM